MSTPTISAQNALRVVEAALAHADELNVNVSVAVVDAGGNLKALARADNATFLTSTLATNKAITAAGLGAPTQVLAEFVGGNPALLAGLSSQPNVALIPGGVPITDNGVLVGAIGVAGGTQGEDHPVAEAGLKVLASDQAGV